MKIVLTGASRGIGRELALQLAEKGHELILISRNSDQLQNICNECNQKAGKELVSAIEFNLQETDTDGYRLIELIQERTDYIDVLFNNAGMLIRKPYEEISSAEAKAVFEVNYFAPAMLIRLLLGMLRKSSRPSIINVTSMTAVQGASKFKGLSVYSASKGALATLTESLAEEYAEEGIKINALAFGAVQTEMLAEAFPGFQAPTSAAEMAEFCLWFIEEGTLRFNGKMLPVTLSTP